MKLTKVIYKDLKAKQQENYNFFKLAALLAEYGFESVRLSNDVFGADFLASHVDGDVLKVQLKGRLTFDKKYIGKDILIGFCLENKWYLVPHDEALERLRPVQTFFDSPHWATKGQWSWQGRPPKKVMNIIEEYEIK